MKEELISVIVPIYNVEKYLRRCVDSILAQTYTNLEVILVDDGSPDSSPAICDEYAQKDKRVKVVHKQNGGLSDARNAGIEIATGKFIAFVDSDDCIEKNMYERLYFVAKENGADISVCGFKRVDENDKPCGKKWLKEYSIFEQNKTLEPLFDSKNVGIVVAWNKLYNRKIFSNIRYPKGLVHEDEYVIYDILKVAKKVVIIPDTLYLYRERQNSIVKTKPTKKMLDAIKAIQYRISQIDKNDVNYAKACSQLLNVYYTLYSKSKTNKELNKEIFEQYKVEYKKNKKCLNLKRRIKHFLFRYFRIIL